MRSFCAQSIAVALIAGLLAPLPAVAEKPQPEPKIGVPYNRELFELAHQVFLANSSLVEALAVTESALREHPADTAWLLKGAQTAEWAGRPDLALSHWFFLARGGNRDAAQAALRVSRSLNELPLRKELLKRMLDEKPGSELYREYLAVLENLGLLEEAYATLASGSTRAIDPVWQLTEQARMAEALGRPDEAFAAWKSRAALKPLNSAESLLLASLWYGVGKPEQASQVLRIASATAEYKATHFWRTLVDIAWSLQKTPETIKGTLLLIQAGEATEADYERLRIIFREADPELLYPFLHDAWRRFKKPVWWHAMVETGLGCGYSVKLAGIYERMTPEERRPLSNDGRSWYYLALVQNKNGDREAGVASLRRAVRLAGNNAELLSACLWLLVDWKQTAELRPLVHYWEMRLGEASTLLREPLAAAMMLLGEPKRALPLYRSLARTRQNDPIWLVSYADVLEQAGHPESAWRERRTAHKMISDRIRSGQENAESERRNLLLLAQLLLNLSPGDELTRLIRRIAAENDDNLTRELVFGWALASGQPDLARLWYWRNFARSASQPEWISLGLSLAEDDTTRIADLLETRGERLPYRDVIQAAERSGMPQVAASLTFENLQVNEDDHFLAERMRDLTDTRPGFLSYSLALEDQAGIGWLQNRMALSQPDKGRYAVKAELTERRFRGLKSAESRSSPLIDLYGDMTLTRLHERGYLALSLGGRDGAFSSFVTSAFEGQWRNHREMNLNWRMEYNALADESASLSVAGMRDRLRLSLSGALTPRDTLGVELAGTRYYDQLRHHLGEGISGNFDLRHQFTTVWPDYGLRGYGGYTASNSDGNFSANSAPPVSSALPGSYAQFGVGAFAGQRAKNVYTKEWLPFAELDGSWTSSAGFGFRYSAGFVSPLFGFDQLKIELRQGAGLSGLAGFTSSINLNYTYRY